MGADLRALRERAELGLRQAADVAGLDAPVVPRAETGKRFLSRAAAKLEHVLSGTMALYPRGQTVLPLDLGSATERGLPEAPEMLARMTRWPGDLELPVGGFAMVPAAVVAER